MRVGDETGRRLNTGPARHITFVNPDMTGYGGKDAMQPLVFAILKHLTPPGFTVKLADERVETPDYQAPTDLVAITCGTFTARRAYAISALYRQRGIPVVIGGFHPTLLPDEVAPHADCVVVGQAEGVWPVLLDDFLNGRLKKRYEAPPPSDLLITGFDYSVFSGKRYFPVNLVEWGRGCHHRCDFCSINAFHHGRECLRPLVDVMADLAGLDSKPVFFVDDNLFHDRTSFRNFLLALIPLKRKWACQISVDVTRHEDLLDLMKASGCMMVLLGIESVDHSNLQQMNKGWSGGYRQAIRAFRRRHITVFGTFIFGYDHDTPSVLENNLRFAIRNRLFMANFNPLYPMPGTALYQRLEREGRLTYDRWWLNPDYYYGKSMYQPLAFSAEDLEELCFSAKRRFNSAGSILARSLDVRANLYGLTRAFFYWLANLTNRREILKKQGKPLASE